jgi:hypothetical protein
MLIWRGVRSGRLDLNDVRDDGNDPLRPLIARACAWIEEARMGGGKVLVHCVSSGQVEGEYKADVGLACGS